MQINIRNFKKNKYLLSLEISHHQPDIILINESGITQQNQLKLQGYKGLWLNNLTYYGIAIFYKYSLQIDYLHFKMEDCLAIKIFTSMGPLLISTTYCPPKNYSIPIVSLNHLFSHQIPILFIGDTNCHHPIFHNSKGNQSDPKGKQMYNLIKNFNLSVLGPDFNTFMTKKLKGKPDLILGNRFFSVFNHLVSPGNDVGSDHIPIIVKIQVQPFKFITPVKNNLKSLNIDKFKQELSLAPVESLDGKNKTEISSATAKLIHNIKTATSNHSDKNKCIIIRPYSPSVDIMNRMTNYQVLCQEFYFFGLHNKLTLTNNLESIINLIKENYADKWKNLVSLASECYGNVSLFWQRFNRLRGGKGHTHTNHLKIKVNNPNSNTNEVIIISEKQEQANTMSRVWSNVFKENPTPESAKYFTQAIENWFISNNSKFTQKEIIDHSSLPANHPLIRPFTSEEICKTIKTSRNSAPGPSGITYFQLKILPKNCIHSLVEIYNSILCTYYFPEITELMKLIFIPKPNKDKSDPLNYRPIALICVVLKVFEKILSQRLQYYLEHNNLLSERQFGFRPERCTQHPITLFTMALQSHVAAQQPALIASKDIRKAFDSCWQTALLFKLNRITNNCNEFTAVIYHFLIMRKFEPHFQGMIGPIIRPLAGIPQGSSIGPVLYSIYVNDCPQAAYDDTVITLFADDTVIMTCSGGKKGRKTRVKEAKAKLEVELTQFLQWEEKWKIQCNLNKSSIHYIGTTKGKLESLGGVEVNGENIPIAENAKILGANFKKNAKGDHNIKIAINKANNSLSKLRRFENAPIKVKKYLFKALVRPILEYPPTLNRNLSKCNRGKLQVMQNKALRFIKGISRKDRVTAKSLHEDLNIDPMNVRLDRLACKSINKMNSIYSHPTNENRSISYKYSDYTINEQPSRSRRRSVADHIHKYILKPRNHENILKKETPWEDWQPPPPIYTFSGKPVSND